MTNELDRKIAAWTSKTDQNVTGSRDGLRTMAEEIDRRITAARRTDAPPADSGGGDNV